MLKDVLGKYLALRDSFKLVFTRKMFPELYGCFGILRNESVKNADTTCKRKEIILWLTGTV